MYFRFFCAKATKSFTSFPSLTSHLVPCKERIENYLEPAACTRSKNINAMREITSKTTKHTQTIAHVCTSTHTNYNDNKDKIKRKSLKGHTQTCCSAKSSLRL